MSAFYFGNRLPKLQYVHAGSLRRRRPFEQLHVAMQIRLYLCAMTAHPAFRATRPYAFRLVVEPFCPSGANLAADCRCAMSQQLTGFREGQFINLLRKLALAILVSRFVFLVLLDIIICIFGNTRSSKTVQVFPVIESSSESFVLTVPRQHTHLSVADIKVIEFIIITVRYEQCLEIQVRFLECERDVLQVPLCSIRVAAPYPPFSRLPDIPARSRLYHQGSLYPHPCDALPPT